MSERNNDDIATARNKTICNLIALALFKSVPKDFGPKAQNLKGKDLFKDLWYGNYFVEK